MTKHINILRYALEMEKRGSQFFKENAEKMSSPSAQELFKRLAEIEIKHYNYLLEQLNHYNNYNELKDFEVDIDIERDLFQERATADMLEHTLVESMAPDLTILRSAYLMERDFAEFYKDASTKVTDEKAKKLFNVLATWEEGHEEIFKGEYDRLMEDYLNQPWGG